MCPATWPIDGLIFHNFFSDTGHEDVVVQGKYGGILYQEGDHSPVDAVGAVAFGGVLPCEVSGSPHHPLAGGGLFPGGTVPALTEDLLVKICSYITDPVTTTDELIPSGETSSYRSNPERLSEFALSRRDP